MDGRSRLISGRYKPFPYREWDQFDGANGPIPILRPMLAVRLQFGDKRWSPRSLVDTGAPFTLFDRATGHALGVDFSRLDARREYHELGGGSYLAQYETVELVVPTYGDLRWTAEVGFFVDDWGMPFPGLLGQIGFLDQWVVSFDYPRAFVIEEREEFRARAEGLSVEEQQAIWEWQELGWKGPPGTR